MPIEHQTINETVLTPESVASSAAESSADASKDTSGADAKGAEGKQTLNEDGTPKVTEAGKEARAEAQSPPTQPQETTAEAETLEATAAQISGGGAKRREPQKPTD